MNPRADVNHKLQCAVPECLPLLLERAVLVRCPVSEQDLRMGARLQLLEMAGATDKMQMYAVWWLQGVMVLTAHLQA